jgi:4-hydroxyphenylpyruvate dioxygenase-like putative hemolysin
LDDVKSAAKEGITLRKLHHICLAVRDVDKTAESFSTIFGIGPFRKSLYKSPPSRAIVNGKPQGYSLKFASAQLGPITIEIVQPIEGKTAVDDFLRRRGEGLHHLAFECDPPIDEEVERWRKKGVEALQIDKNISDDPKYGWAYMDTERIVGCVLEIMCLPPKK